MFAVAAAWTHWPRAASSLAPTEPKVAAGRGLSDVVTVRTPKAAPDTSEDSTLGRAKAGGCLLSYVRTWTT